MNLRLDWCSHAAASYAVERWHYSGRMPLGPLVRLGVWEDGRYVGCVLFARGNTPTLGRRYGLDMTEVCELVRIALTQHESPVSRIVAVAVRLLKRANPGLRLIVSFADPAQGHVGAIYQASNWIYAGLSHSEFQFYHQGRWKHRREITSGAFGGQRKVRDYSGLPRRLTPGKHRYVWPLDDEMRQRIAPLAQPYPKRPTGVESDTTAHQAVERGARPTVGLQRSDDHERISAGA